MFHQHRGKTPPHFTPYLRQLLLKTQHHLEHLTTDTGFRLDVRRWKLDVRCSLCSPLRPLPSARWPVRKNLTAVFLPTSARLHLHRLMAAIVVMLFEVSRSHAGHFARQKDHDGRCQRLELRLEILLCRGQLIRRQVSHRQVAGFRFPLSRFPLFSVCPLKFPGRRTG